MPMMSLPRRRSVTVLQVWQFFFLFSSERNSFSLVFLGGRRQFKVSSRIEGFQRQDSVTQELLLLPSVSTRLSGVGHVTRVQLVADLCASPSVARPQEGQAKAWAQAQDWRELTEEIKFPAGNVGSHCGGGMTPPPCMATVAAFHFMVFLGLPGSPGVPLPPKGRGVPQWPF